jgi:RNA polymerase sigma factor (sigma-70 family)
MSRVLDDLRRVALATGEPDLTDGQLLDCFVNRGDAAALAAIVQRHGPMVWGVCRRILRNHQDAEDAFQATFLVLVRKAASILPREMVGNWLYGVAHQTALKARATTAKRQAREKHVSEMPEPEALTEPELWHDLQPLLDQELSQLPDKYRVAIILCDLQGRTRRQVARELEIPEGTLSSRLTTARGLLARRLARQGLAVSGGVLAVVLPQKAGSACVPTSVVSSTLEAATILAAGNGAAGMVSLEVAALTEGVLKSMLVTKLKVATVSLLVLGAIGLGITVTTHGASASARGKAATNAATTTPARGSEVAVEAGEIRRADSAEKSKAEGQAAIADAEKPKAQDRENQTNEKPLQGRASNNPRLRALLEERLDSLRKMAAQVKQLHKANAASQGTVREANLRVYQAELDLCDTTGERIAVLEKIARLYKEAEDHVSELQKQSAASQGEVLEARIKRLEAEIAVEREKAKRLAPSR